MTVDDGSSGMFTNFRCSLFVIPKVKYLHGNAERSGLSLKI